MAEHRWVENNVKVGDDLIWDKESEPVLEGQLIKIETGVGSHESTLYTIKKDDDTEVKVWGSTVLDDRFLGVPEGTYVKVTYEGLKKGKNGKSYHNYKVYIDEDSVPQQAPKTGYETARAQADSLKTKDAPPEDEPFPLSDIPF